MTELEQLRDEALKYRTLFVLAVSYYGQDAPYEEKKELRKPLLAALGLIENDFMQRFDEDAHLGELCLAELQTIGGQNG